MERKEAQAANIDAECRHKQKDHREATFFHPTCTSIHPCVHITLEGRGGGLYEFVCFFH